MIIGLVDSAYHLNTKNSSIMLFDNPANPEDNLLPFDGEVYYFGKIFTDQQAVEYARSLFENIEWKNDEAYIFGKHIVTKRKVAWYADKPFNYTYSNATKTALLWTNELKVLKKVVENTAQNTYNSCLLNLYHAGDEGMAWHSDGEKELVKHGSIASVSFGAERKFSFKHKKTNETVSVLLESGSLLIMAGATQDHWLHRLPPTKKVHHPRINLTFRQMMG
ncbi:MAG: alpha-ketoglutarate-dependent dioxygenase AlkB [Fulvivirga sp.]